MTTFVRMSERGDLTTTGSVMPGAVITMLSTLTNHFLVVSSVMGLRIARLSSVPRLLAAERMPLAPVPGKATMDFRVGAPLSILMSTLLTPLPSSMNVQEMLWNVAVLLSVWVTPPAGVFALLG